MLQKSLRAPGDIAITYYVSACANSRVKTLVIVNPVQGISWWLPLVELLGSEYHIIGTVPRDFPSCSKFLSQDESLFHHHAEDIALVLDQEQVSSAHFLGWCYGAKAMLDVCRRWPSVVQSMMGLGAIFWRDSSVYRPLLRYGKPDKILKLIQMLKRIERPAEDRPKPSDLRSYLSAEGILQALFSKYKSDHPAVFRYQDRLSEMINTEKAAMNALRLAAELSDADLNDFVACCTTPLLVVQGSDDEVIQVPEHAKTIYRSNQSICYQEVAGATHYIQYEDPCFVAESLRAFHQRHTREHPGNVSSSFFDARARVSHVHCSLQ